DHDHEDHEAPIGGEADTEEGEEESPLEKYLHEHDDPEEATLYTQSIKSMLRQAMAEMWDAELYLRLYKPEKSLPYQYKALGLIKKIKNQSRIYVHRIGFDPPPIKEEKRLTGELDEVRSSRKVSQTEDEFSYPAIREALTLIERKLLDFNEPLSKEQKILFDSVGQKLAPLATAQPARYLNALEYCKQLATIDLSKKELHVLLKKIYPVLTRLVDVDHKEIIRLRTTRDELTQKYLKNLNQEGIE
ncbi:MAG: hypothetical protein R3345_14940, partial [Fulvivirga sp.]|nr:hypothetical protein [Fulvivirga sp.]